MEMPAPAYRIEQLVVLAGYRMTTRQLRRWLVRKGVVKEVERSKRQHLVETSRLMTMWPAFWSSLERAWSKAGIEPRREEGEEDAA